MDSTQYKINYGGMIPTERLHAVNWADCTTFMLDVLNGTLTNFSISGLLQNNSDYVVKIVYYPIKVDLLFGSTVVYGTIPLGTKVASNVTSSTWLLSVQNYINIGYFSPTRIHNNFLDFEPYTKMTFHCSYFEPIELPLEMVYGKTIYVYLSGDLVTNNFTLYLYTSDGTFIASKTAKIGIEISMGKTNKEEQTRNNILNGIGFLGSTLGVGMGVVSGKPLAVVGGIAGLTKNAKETITTNVDMLKNYRVGVGDRSSLGATKEIYVLLETVKDVRYPNYALKGGICKKNLSLSSVTGYTEISDIHFNPSGSSIMDDEISEIIDLLKSGVIL